MGKSISSNIKEAIKMGNEFSDKLKDVVEQEDKLDVLKDKASNSANEIKHRTEEKAADLKTDAKEKKNDLKDHFSDQ